MNDNNYNEPIKKIITTNKKSKKGIASKIIFSIIFGFICGGLLAGYISLFITILLRFDLIKYMFFLLTVGLFIWLFIKSPNLKKMWFRILLSVGLMLLFFPIVLLLHRFIHNYLGFIEYTDFSSLVYISIITLPEFISNTHALGTSIIISLILGSGLLTGAYFLRKR